jgi:hypothetical protein
MTELKVDPIKYAWEQCNRGACLPEVLTRSNTGPPLTYNLSSALILSGSRAERATVQAAIHSRILGSRRRAPNRKFRPPDFS